MDRYVDRQTDRQTDREIDRLVGSNISLQDIKKLRTVVLHRPRRRWVDNIKMDLIDVGWDGMDWIDLAQDRDRWRLM
jgi:hypothetical protein